MKVSSMKVILAIVLTLSASVCLFAEDGWFILQHNINVSDDYWFEFWAPSTENPLTGSVSIASVLPTRFATLAVHYQGRSIVSLSVGFTPLFRIEGEALDKTTIYDYSMEVLKPGDNTALVSASDYYASTLNVGGVEYPMTKVDIYSRQSIGSANGVGKYAIADFRITLNDEDLVPAGSYKGFLTFFHTSP